MPRPASVAIVGVGHSPVYRFDDVSLGRLTIDACRTAVVDAGLTMADIDGVVGDPRQPFPGAGAIDGVHMVTAEWLIQAMHMDVCWYDSSAGGTLSRSIISGANAVASGMCQAVVVYRALHNPKGRYGFTAPAAVGGADQFSVPYGLYAPGTFAQLWTRYMRRYGTTREQMAPFLVNNRKNGLKWEHGYWAQHRPVELTIEDYVDQRMVSWPIGLHDCDIPLQGAGAFVITSAERARDLPNKPAYILGSAMPGKVGGWTIYSTLEVVQDRASTFANHLLANAGVTVGDVDVANLYDGFSIFVPLWLEAFGFCGPGEGFDFLAPENIAIAGGKLPVNTSGGNLGAGRMHGVPHMMDSVLQVQGRSGPRQVAGAEVVLCTAGSQPGLASGVVLGASPS